MKNRKLALKVGSIVLALAMGATVIWWRAKVHRETHPWAYPENHARILAEARVNGWVVETTDPDGNTYYLMGSSKYGWVIRPEDVDYWGLWRQNQALSKDLNGRGTSYSGFRGNLGLKEYPTFHDDEYLELDLTVKEVPEGTTVEELMAQEANSQ